MAARAARRSTSAENSPSNLNRFFDGPNKWDRASVEVEISESTFRKWLHDVPSSDDDVRADDKAEAIDGKLRKLIVFSGNDYLGLSSHPMVSNAAIKAAQEHGMGPRGSALIFNQIDCLLCPTGFSANMAFMTAVGNVGLLVAGGKLSKDDRVAIFSDALNHASIIDGIRLAERQGNAVAFVYRHADMCHLDALLSSCPMKKRVVVTDSLFSMDGFLLMQHLFCGKSGGGAAEMFNCEADVDICIGTLGKAAGCHGGFIACSKKWKLLIQSRGRSFIFSTSLPVPVAAAAHAAVNVAKNEAWRRSAIWTRIHIISLIVGSENKALQASRHLLKLGFHITAIRLPTVPALSCRLRVTLSAAHTKDNSRKLTNALSQCVDSQKIQVFSSNFYSKLLAFSIP
ncbi:hypothetical protein MIMGU_mgv1a022763mg, partial [Erythranthe guttata]